jgi:outer membrane cobalamin receptor
MYDTQGKIVYDITPSSQLQFSWLGGRFLLDNSNERDMATLSDDWRTDNQIGLMTAALRTTFGPQWMLTQRVATVLNRYSTEGFFGGDLQRASQRELSYRADLMFGPSEVSVLKAGFQALHDSGRLNVIGYGWTDPSRTTIAILRDDWYKGDAWRPGAYVSYRWRPSKSWTLNPGVRADRFTLTGEDTVSPWISLYWTSASRWEVTAGTGIFHQHPSLYQVLGPTGGGQDLRAERTWHTDVSVAHQLGTRTRVVANAYVWEERRGIRRLNGEPRIVNDQVFWPSYTAQRYANTLEGSSKGLELTIENNNPNGLSGWLSYSLSHTQYRDVVQEEEMWGDYDQRHTVNAYCRYRVSPRTSVSALFRYGSNYPLVGYYAKRDGTWYVGSDRNTQRLPDYARLDLRVDRSYDFAKYRATWFAQILNVLNRENKRRLPHRLRGGHEYTGVYQALLGLTPTLGVLVEF